MTAPPRKPILISGAGLGALLLAQSLHRADIPFVLLERDAAAFSRPQGYQMRISAIGLEAIETVLGPEAFQRLLDQCGHAPRKGFTTVDAITMEVRTDVPGLAAIMKRMNEGEHVTADDKKMTTDPMASRNDIITTLLRAKLRKALLEGMEPYIRYSCNVTEYQLSPSGSGVRAVFADGSLSEEGEMLIAADGLYSKVSRKLSKGAIQVYDTGARGIHAMAYSSAFQKLGAGIWSPTDTTSYPGSKLFIITNASEADLQNPGRKVPWVMAASPGVIKMPITNDRHAIQGLPAAKVARELTQGWHPRLQPLFDELISDECAFWKITTSYNPTRKPQGVAVWDNEPRVTAMGDAAHAMTPAGGVGGNCAFKDAELLGRLLRERWTAAGADSSNNSSSSDSSDSGADASLVAGVTLEYERQMRVYASEAVKLNYYISQGQYNISIDENSPII